jgi:hypothetical protein
MLEGISFAAPALPAIAAHHERVDGSGYPRGLLGPDIPLGARVIAVADGFDALTVGTPDAAPLSPQEALDQLGADRGLDPAIVDALARAVERHGILEVTEGADWSAGARVGGRARPASDTGRPGAAARSTTVLAAESLTPSWVIRHDHPRHRSEP